MAGNTIVEAKVKKGNFSIKYIINLLKINLLPTILLTAFWTFLGWLRTAGIQWAILWPLNFLTGALNGLSGNTVGGTIGKTLLLIMFNGMFRKMISAKGNWKERKKGFVKAIKDDGIMTIIETIPQFSDLNKMFKDTTPRLLCFSGLGLGTALFVYPFITGDGSIVNSMVCVALFLNIGKQLVEQRGLIISLMNMILEKKSWKTINKDVINRIIAGFAVGMAVAVPVATMKMLPGIGIILWNIFVKLLPVLIVAISLGGILVYNSKSNSV